MDDIEEIESQFYITETMQCPYLPDKKERKIFTNITGKDAQKLHEYLSWLGFRRSHSISYLPVCPDCSECIPVRVDVKKFVKTKSVRRLINKNKELKVTKKPSIATVEQYGLFTDYLKNKHPESDMNEMDFNDYQEMIEECPVNNCVYEFRDEDNILVSAMLTDIMPDGLSAIYSFYSMKEPKKALGRYSVIWLIEEALHLKLPYVYLGYWIKESPKMSYKSDFRPLEAFGCRGWLPIEEYEFI